MTLAQPLQLLMQARDRYTQREIAEYVGKDIKTVRRWEKGETPCPAMLEPALRNLLQSPASTTGKPGARFRVIDGNRTEAEVAAEILSLTLAWLAAR